MTLDENPTTGFITLHNAKRKESKSGFKKSLSPAEDHVVEMNSYFADYPELKTRYASGICGAGGVRVITFGLIKPGVHTVYLG